MNLTIVFFMIYAGIAIAMTAASYFIGRMVETNMGSQISLIVFLILFMTSLISAFPIAMKISPDDGSKSDIV
jgi:hypothetical protein